MKGVGERERERVGVGGASDITLLHMTKPF